MTQQKELTPALFIIWAIAIVLTFIFIGFALTSCGSQSPTRPTEVTTTTIPIQQVFEFTYLGQKTPNTLLRYRVPVEKQVRVVGRAPIEEGNVSPTDEIMERRYEIPCGTRAFAELITLRGAVEQLIEANIPSNCKPGSDNEEPPITPNPPPDVEDDPVTGPPPTPPTPPEPPPPEPEPQIDAVAEVSIRQSSTYGFTPINIEVWGQNNCDGRLMVSGPVTYEETFENGNSIKPFYWDTMIHCEAQRRKVFTTLVVDCPGDSTTARAEIELPNCQDLGIK